MKFDHAAELFKPVSIAVSTIGNHVGAQLASAIGSSSLDKLEGTFYYIPIVMPPEMRKRYPARAKFYKKDKLFGCCPHLDYEVFLDGKFVEQMHEYVRGIDEGADGLVNFGAGAEEVREFRKLLAAIRVP